MPSRRYTILIADRSSGVVRRVTISAGPAVAVACAIVTLPVLIGIGAAWKAKGEVASLYSTNRSLEAENANYRGATGALSDQIESLQSVVADLGARSALDPTVARAVEKLPAFVKSRAMGGAQAAPFAQQAAKTFSALAAPEDTFGCFATCSRDSRAVFLTCGIWSSGEMPLPPQHRQSGRPRDGSPPAWARGRIR